MKTIVLTLAMLFAVTAHWSCRPDHHCSAAEAEPIILKSYAEAHAAMKKYKVPGIFIFTAQWCEPCHTMKKETIMPLMPRLKTKYIVYFVDTDAETEVAQAWQETKRLQSIPAYALTTRGGEYLIGYDEGYKTQAGFIKWINDSVRAYNKRQKEGKVREVVPRGRKSR